MTLSQIKSKIQNLGEFKSLKQIKKAGLRIVYNKKADAYWLIEQEFLKPVIKSPRKCKSIVINLRDLKYQIFMCHKSESELQNCKALDYIKWGERQGFDDAPTVQNRKYWWACPDFSSKIFMQMSFNDVYKFWYSNHLVRCDARFYTISLTQMGNAYFLNSSLTALFIELFGRANLGEGALDFKVYEADEILILNPKFYPKTPVKLGFFKRSINAIFTELGFDPHKPIRGQEPKPLPDRAELDKIVFDALNLTEQERQEVYFAVAELVQNRLAKAGSV